MRSWMPMTWCQLQPKGSDRPSWTVAISGEPIAITESSRKRALTCVAGWSMTLCGRVGIQNPSLCGAQPFTKRVLLRRTCWGAASLTTPIPTVNTLGSLRPAISGAPRPGSVTVAEARRPDPQPRERSRRSEWRSRIMT